MSGTFVATSKFHKKHAFSTLKSLQSNYSTIIPLFHIIPLGKNYSKIPQNGAKITPSGNPGKHCNAAQRMAIELALSSF
jgi:hypothetical protein